jgi:perosamine synthetase
MDVDKFQEGDNAGVSAVVHVSHNGHCGESSYLAGVCRKMGLPLIEDSAVALGVPGACQVGTMSILSFSVPKIVTTGQGGAVLTDSAAHCDRLDAIRDQGGENWRKDRIHRNIGVNLRMTDLQAALGIAQMKEIDKILARRARIWNVYRIGMAIANDIHPSGWMVTVRCENGSRRHSVEVELADHGYSATRLYRPIYQNSYFKADPSLFPGAKDYYDRVLYLPSSLTLSYTDIHQISRIAYMWN